jgi:Uma2 family endonuclease
MSIAKDQTAAPDTQEQEWDDIVFPPGDLWSDEPALESYLHLQQLLLLLKCLDWWWRNRNDYFAAGNLTVSASSSSSAGSSAITKGTFTSSVASM